MNKYRNGKQHSILKHGILKFIAVFAGLALAAEPSLSALAATDYTTYEQYRAGEEAEVYSESEADYTVVEIASEEDLVTLAENCELDVWSLDKYVKLTANIDLKENRDICIPSFGGVFDGNGYRISGLQITRQGSAMGLFRYVQTNGRVRNLTVEGKVIPDGTQSQVGGIVGINYGKLYNLSFEGQVSGDTEVGGIAGANGENGEIRKCHSSAVVVGNHSAGGIAGSNHGILNNCSNEGDINTYSTEVTYQLEDITIENIEDLNSTSNVAAHTDSGGIAGISDGKIYYCSNSGTVGYSHVGYNAGGIVGRLHQGYLQNCTNTGHILGRKDVGGIVGQMEPFLEIEYLNGKLQELDRETDKFLDLLDAAHQDLRSYGKQASTLTKALTGNLKTTSSAGNSLTGTVNDMWYIYNQELSGINNDVKILNDDLKNQGSHDVTVSTGDLPGIGTNGGNNGTDNGSDSGDGVVDSVIDKVNDALNDNSVNVTVPVPDDTESYKAALRKFADSASSHLSNMTGATTDRSGGINDNLKKMNDSMDAAGNELEQLADVLEAGTDKTGDNVDALVEQAKVLRKLISEVRDDLFRYEGITIEDSSDEAASDGTDSTAGSEQVNDESNDVYYDTTSFQKGKVTLSVNKGLVEADTNVGGIVGQIATEYDFDPEDDVTLTGTESFDIEQTVKAVVRDSRNLGDVISKKDCVGGIVGKADFGAIISCESYSGISSTDGSNVGGIAGVSSYAIRDCYTMGELSGKNNLGGIAGKGCDIFYSYAYNTMDMTGECQGSIAGVLDDAGTLFGNYYVTGSVGGIDGIGYQGGATPLTYEEFCSMDGVPEEFSNFTVTFMADGQELASYNCRYGDSLSTDQIPDIPEKDGYYGAWEEYNFDNITGNKILEAEYNQWVTALASQERDENGKEKVLVEGEFLPDSELMLSEDNKGTNVWIETPDKDGNVEIHKGKVKVRVHSEDPENTMIDIVSDLGYQRADTKVLGSYLVFEMDTPGTFMMTIAEKDSMIMWYVAGVGALALAILILLLIDRKARKRRKANTNDKGSTL